MDTETLARLSGLEIPEEVEYKDASRPTFNRAPGQVGLYVTVLDITPEDPKEYGSMKFMWQDLSDKLLAYLQTHELYKIKVTLESKGLMQGVVLDNYVTGLILAVSCDNPAACDVIDKEMKSGQLPEFFKKRIETKDTLKALRCTHLEVRISHYDDEIEACKKDFTKTPVITKDLAHEPYDRKTLRVAREFQQKYTKTLYQLRDDQIKFEAKMGEFLNLCKTYLPAGIREFHTMGDFEKLVKRAKDRKASHLPILEHYSNSLTRVRDGAKNLLKGVLYVLAQVHAGSETEQQRTLKAKLNTEIREVLQWLQPDYDYSKFTHDTWQNKVMLVERNMFLGLVCFLPVCIDKVIDCDHIIDDYFDLFKVDINK